ncbi:hypothetical protein FB639_000648 [Coemansia asiatica]|nr:hypothetical protein FB639_000648 [Coemansia asiatica]
MAKRSGSVSVEYESSERKRLRNAVPVSLASWVVSPVSEDRRCADNIAACLQSSRNDSLQSMMDTAVRLIQDLKLLQSFRTAYAMQAFEGLYAKVLDYVGKVIDQIKKADRANIRGDQDEESVLNSFAGLYQYLVEIVAKHAEYSCINKSGNNLDQSAATRDFRLASLPLAFEYSVETALSTTNNTVAPPDFLEISHGPRIQTVTRKSVASSLVAVVLSPRAYMQDCIDWTASAFGWSLAQTSDNTLRLAAWALFPMFCMHTAERGIDGFLTVNSQARVKVGDPEDLLEVVANSIGYVSCARSGYLCINAPEAVDSADLSGKSSDSGISAACLQWGQTSDSISISSFATGISSIYSCTVCDSPRNACSAQKQNQKQSKVSLSGWLPYWFIALNNVPESASVRFVRNVTRFVRHAEVQDISLRSSPLGRGIIRRLSSSNRELRLAAVDSVLAYSTVYPEDTEYIAKIKRVNRIETIFTLQQMVQELEAPRLVEETLELVAGGLGCACGLYDDVLCQIMPFLIKYYCGDNIFLRAVAMEQILRIAQKHADSARQESSTRRKALRAIGELVILLGSKLTPHTNNIVASLTPSLQGPLAATALRSWIILAESLVKTTLLADQINSLLVPLLTAFFTSSDAEVRSGAAEAVNRIVGLHKRNIRASCDKVCSVPDHPQLEIAFTIFQGFIGRNSLRQRLSGLLQMLKGKDSTIVFCASRELCTLLQTNEKQIVAWKQAFMQDGSNISGIDDSSYLSGRSKERNTAAADARLLNSISEALKSACSHASDSHRLGRQATASCAACLAVIGVIDKRVLETNTRSDAADPAKAAMQPVRVSPNLCNLQDEEERMEFVCTLIVDYLVHAFAMAPSPSVQLCAAYSIQELLRLVGFTKSLVQQQLNSDNSAQSGTKSAIRGGRRKNDSSRRAASRVNNIQDERILQRWSLIPASVQEIISPLLDSKYTIQQSGRKRTDTGATAGSRTACIVRSSSYIGWLRAWSVELATALSASCPSAAIFKVCTSAMKESSADMLLFLLPQIAHQYCLNVSSDKADHTKSAAKSSDMSSDKPIVIDDDEQDSKDQSTAMDVDDDAAVAARATRHIVSNEIHAVFVPDSEIPSLPGDQWRLCKEVCLDLLDTFSSHVRSQQSMRVTGKRSARKDSQYANTTPEEEALLKLIKSAPHATIAQVAASCHQYERAVLHTELALRENAFGKYPTLFGNVDDSAIATIQELYFSMGDVDGVIGASLCRKQVDHKLAIRKYEIEGNWSHALIGHESLLRAQPDNEEFQKSWISCLQKMGQWEGAWATSKELFKLRPRNEDEQQLNAACYAAAWRLGKWNWVQETASMADALPNNSMVQQRLPDFNALNSAMLLRMSRDKDLEDLKRLELPIPLQSLNAAKSSLNSSNVLNCAAIDLVDLALASIGRGIADTVSTRLSFSSNSQPASTTLSKTPSEVHAHMLGDISIMAGHLATADIRSDCEKLSAKLGDLFEQWRKRVACLPAIYSVQEPILMLHSRLFDMLLSHIQFDTAHSHSHGHGHGHCTQSNGSTANTCKCADSIMRQKVRTNLQAAQLARVAGYRATAMGILVHSELTCSPTPALRALLQTEYAQILWDEGHSADAMSSLIHVTDNLQEQLNIPTISSTNPDMYSSKSTLSVSNTRAKYKDGATLSDTENAYVRAMFPLLDWQVATNSLSLPLLIKRYDQVLAIQESDKAYYAIGRLHDILFSAVGRMGSRSSKSRQGGWDRQIVILQSGLIRNYLRSILHSSRYLFQALPRLLTVWFDFSTSGPPIPEKPSSDKDMIGHLVKQIDTVVTNMTNRLPMYNFLVVLSQLVSRICHDNPNVFKHLQTIILKLLEFYPQQTLWQLMGVQRSTFAVRAQRCQTILDMARSIASGPQKVGVLIEQASKLTDSLLALCDSLPPSRTTTTMHMSRDFQQLAKSRELDIIIPLQQSLVPTLPDTQHGSDCELALSASSTDRSFDEHGDGSSIDSNGHNGIHSLSAAQRMMMHQPFSSDLPTISGFENEIEIMMSLQRPKKITMIGSDGKRYSFLCKPKDDLRKDARLMEFNSMINRLLNSNAETHKRSLHIRTYAVVPLNEECGLIQWVAPTTGIRHVLLKLYKAHNVTISMSQVKAILEKPTLPPAEAFVKTLLPLFPSVMHEWFLQSFPDPPRWLASRTNFTRSAAVMSMVGHILGLGDRHCENILLDESTGSVVHVDFNCLFEKGMTLEKPEKVPFRLTHNMVDAMGVTGYEGTFRKTCEMTLNLLRDNRDALMSVLESFLHDPLVEWSRRTTRASRQAAASTAPAKSGANQPNEQAAKCLNTINRKLQGILQGVAPLSVEGQVDALIREATSPDRLFQMYIGWAAYM